MIIITSVSCMIAGYFLGKSDYNKKILNLNLRLKDLENRCEKMPSFTKEESIYYLNEYLKKADEKK